MLVDYSFIGIIIFCASLKCLHVKAFIYFCYVGHISAAQLTKEPNLYRKSIKQILEFVVVKISADLSLLLQTPSLAEPTSSDPTAQEATDQLAGSQAPPSAGTNSQ